MTVTDLLFQGLMTTFWVSVLTALVLFARKPVTARFGARAAVLLWMIPAARLVMPTLQRKVPIEPVASPEPASATVAPVAVVEHDKPADPMPMEAVVDTMPVSESPPVLGIHTDVIEAVLPAAEPVLPPMIVDVAPLLLLPTNELLAGVVLSIWFAGAAITGAFCWMHSRRWRETIVAEAQPTSPALQVLASEAAERAKVTTSFEIVVSAAADTPQLLGLRRPLIALPTDFTQRFSREEQEMALLHELTHLKRGDLLVMLMTEAATALQWFNPLAAAARRAVRDDQEAACDEAVRGLGVCRRSYAALLVKAASQGRAVPALTLDHSLKERIILMASPVSSPLIRGGFALLACASAAAMAAATASYTDVFVTAAASEEEAWEAQPETDQKSNSRHSASEAPGYWDRYATDGRDDHLYTAFDEQQDVVFEARREFVSEERPERVRVVRKRAEPRVVTVGDDSHSFAFADHGVVDSRGGEAKMILLSDPFSGIVAPDEMEIDIDIPEPPVPEMEERKVDGGRWVFIPDEPDMSAFEEAMEDFEQRMESWGAKMEVFGERMGAAGEAVGELSERCDRHLRDSKEPIVLTERVAGEGNAVRAVCVAGGIERFRSNELMRFVERQRLSSEEKAYYRQSVRSRG